MTWTLVSLAPLPAEAVKGMLAGLPLEVVVPERDPAAVRAAVAGADIVLGDWSGGFHVDADLLTAAPRLAFVQQPSVGVEGHDLEALAASGVPLANTAGANTASVAEWCIGAALAVSRSMVWADAEVRAGRWPQVELTARGCQDLASRRVGILGFGAIGTECARRFASFGCELSYWSRSPRPEGTTHGAVYRDLPDLIATSDVLVVVVALSDETRGILDGQALATMPTGAVLVNAARGGIVDETALLAHLDSGHLSGAALDVFDGEPLADDSPLRGSDRVLLSPHAAGASAQAVQRLFAIVLDNLGRVVRGEPVNHVVNGVDPLVRRR